MGLAVLIKVLQSRNSRYGKTARENARVCRCHFWSLEYVKVKTQKLEKIKIKEFRNFKKIKKFAVIIWSTAFVVRVGGRHCTSTCSQRRERWVPVDRRLVPLLWSGIGLGGGQRPFHGHSCLKISKLRSSRLRDEVLLHPIRARCIYQTYKLPLKYVDAHKH